MNVRSASKRGTSLGLLTPTSFELQLLEVALKGKTMFETQWDEKCANYDIDMQVMCHEILLEIDVWEKNGSVKPLQERARDLVVKMKDTSLHSRAMVVYRDFLDLGRSPRKTIVSKPYQDRQRVSTEFSFKVPGSNNSSQVRQRDSIEFSSHIPDSTEFSSTRVPSTSDEKFDRMIDIELPLSVDDDSSTPPKEDTQKLQGEPNICDLSTSGDVLSCEALAIFDKPTETDEGRTSPRGDDELIFDLSINLEPSDGDSIFLLSNEEPMTPGSVCSCHGDALSECDDVKRDFGENPWQLPAKLGSFPGKDFQGAIEWTVDKTTYWANNLADLRSKHDVLIEGTFRKRCRTKRWRDYYGFFLGTGVMIYFRNEVYKKVADFRKCTVTLQKSKPSRLIVQDVYVDTKQTDWPLEFNNPKHLSTWHHTIASFSKRSKKDKAEQASHKIL